MKRDRTTQQVHHGALIAPGTLLGIGLGGFLDGIVLHQILQGHNMLSSVIAPVDLVNMKYNMVWDGLFHAFTSAATCVTVTSGNSVSSTLSTKK